MSTSIARVASFLVVAGVQFAASAAAGAQEYLYVGNSLGGDISVI